MTMKENEHYALDVVRDALSLIKAWSNESIRRGDFQLKPLEALKAIEIAQAKSVASDLYAGLDRIAAELDCLSTTVGNK